MRAEFFVRSRTVSCNGRQQLRRRGRGTGSMRRRLIFTRKLTPAASPVMATAFRANCLTSACGFRCRSRKLLSASLWKFQLRWRYVTHATVPLIGPQPWETRIIRRDPALGAGSICRTHLRTSGSLLASRFLETAARHLGLRQLHPRSADAIFSNCRSPSAYPTHLVRRAILWGTPSGVRDRDSARPFLRPSAFTRDRARIVKKVVRRTELLKGHCHGFRLQGCS